MAKGFFTQGMAVLFRRPVSIGDVRGLIERTHEVAKELPAHEKWELSGPALVLRYRDELNGVVAVDTVDHPWPDEMGDPRTDGGKFAAWAMGHFGPLTYPGNLRRATEHACGWESVKELLPSHGAFVRILLSYVFGAGEDEPVIPAGVDPVHELEFVTRIARSVLDHPDAICVFNPGGELLLDAANLDARLDAGRRSGVPPLDAWCNIRLYELGDGGDGWLVMDTVGNEQFDLPDLEAAFPTGRIEPAEVDPFLRNATLHLLQHGPVLKNGDTMDGPGSLPWQAWQFEEGLMPHPRRVMRWIPIRPDAERRQLPVPDSLLPAEEASRRADERRAPWWKRWGW